MLKEKKQYKQRIRFILSEIEEIKLHDSNDDEFYEKLFIPNSVFPSFSQQLDQSFPHSVNPSNFSLLNPSMNETFSSIKKVNVSDLE